MLSRFLLHSKENQLYVYTHPFCFGFLSPFRSPQSTWTSPATQQVPLVIYFIRRSQMRQSRRPSSSHPTPFSRRRCPCLFSASVHLPYLHVFLLSVSWSPNTQASVLRSPCRPSAQAACRSVLRFLSTPSHSLWWDWCFLFLSRWCGILQIQFWACVLH